MRSFRCSVVLLALLPLLSCGDDPAPAPGGGSADGGDGTGDGDGTDGTDGADGADGSDGTEDTGEPITWTDVPDRCDGDGPDGVDPFTLIGMVKNTEPAPWFTEILDLSVQPETERVLTAGQGGVVVFDIADPTDPITRDHIGAGGGSFSRYYHVWPASSDLAYATHREFGLDVLDVSDADRLTRVTARNERGYEGLAASDEHIYVASTDGFVDVWSIADPRDPRWVSRVEGLTRPWDVALGAGVAYVADGTEGIVALSLADPAAPTRAGTAPSVGFPVRLTVHEDALYVVSGAGGLEIYDLSDPLAPTPLSQVDVGGSALDVHVADGLVAVTTQEAVVLLDIGRAGSPGDPLPFAYEETEQYAMAVDSEAGTWAVGDWNILGLWDVGEGPAPALDLGKDVAAFLDGPGHVDVSMVNRGGATLDLYGVDVPDGLTAQVSDLALEPGQRGWIRLTWDGTTDVDDVRMCIASDDPGRPTQTLTVSTGNSGVGRVIGQQAPDFELQDLDGNTYRLSEQAGHPVVLAYFATW